MAEEQRYRVIAHHGDAELREYEPCVVADVVVSGDAENAGSAAFRPLFNYISGANRTGTSLAMTAPVLQEAGGERLAMTAPVLQETSGPDSWIVSFVLPGDRALQEYPTPTDPQVTLRALPAQQAAALRWSGRWNQSNIAKRTEELQTLMHEAGWDVAGDARWARFDPPWTPPFMRRNEIVIPVGM